MSTSFHPGLTRNMAEQLAATIFDTNIELMETVSLAEGTLNAHACRAADIMGNDPSCIEALVWYRGGDHPLTCRDQIEELEIELATKDALLERAAALLGEYHSELDCSGETDSRAANEIRKLLTDIEHT
jgi:hypothetical protein